MGTWGEWTGMDGKGWDGVLKTVIFSFFEVFNQHMSTTSQRSLLPRGSINIRRVTAHWRSAAPFSAVAGYLSLRTPMPQTATIYHRCPSHRMPYSQFGVMRYKLSTGRQSVIWCWCWQVRASCTCLCSIASSLFPDGKLSAWSLVITSKATHLMPLSWAFFYVIRVGGQWVTMGQTYLRHLSRNPHT